MKNFDCGNILVESIYKTKFSKGVPVQVQLNSPLTHLTNQRANMLNFAIIFEIIKTTRDGMDFNKWGSKLKV